jgi:hypothetical protein
MIESMKFNHKFKFFGMKKLMMQQFSILILFKFFMLQSDIIFSGFSSPENEIQYDFSM